ncbi:MAG: phosphopantothenoylcysteine decarboxylase [Planctomycetaceae bacterium]|nr:phosphopantothenoylcysteine decarboxylase [Planctomycetales bacterium]MCB9923670.1 phosphopantothenoylcysteine decarboxylase [Planctomycetaceae bacterium]
MSGCEILVGVSGGIASYKTAALVSQLVQTGYGVSVVMTKPSQHFIAQATFAALTGRAVATEIFDDASHPLGAHITLAERAQLFCIAPATANFMAKAAQGIADDLLSTLYLSFAGKTLIAPAMNCEMWEKPAVQRNLKQLREDGVAVVDPEEGWLSCRKQGVGRMAAPEKILAAIQKELA